MFEAKLTIECPALEALAAAIGRMAAPVHNAVAAPTPQPIHAPTAPQQFQSAVIPQMAPTAAPVMPAPVANPTTAPVGAPPVTGGPTMNAAHSNAVPTAPYAAPPAPPTVPVAPAPSFTYEQVGTAGANLIAADPNKLPELLALLGQFGAPAVTELKPEQLGAFATELRRMGGKI